MTTQTYTIDASKKRIGRVAADAASALAGKKLATYYKGRMPGVAVVITNASKMNIDPKKRSQKEYLRYTWYPGGLKGQSMDEMIAKKGMEEVLRLAVYGMLPRTKLRPEMMKLLTVKD